METRKILSGGISGAILFLFFEWLVYYNFLMAYWSANVGNVGNECLLFRSQPEMMNLMWILVLANLAWGFLFALIFTKIPNLTFSKGFWHGAIIGFLIAVGLDFTLYATTNMMRYSAVLLDIIGFSAICAFSAGLIAVFMNLVKPKP